MGKTKVSNPEQLDVDTRFLLANERTLLAWIRTALAVLAGGLAFSYLGEHTPAQTRVGVLAALFAGVMTLIGYWRYRMADKAIRSGSLPSKGNGPILQVAGIICFIGAVVIIELTRL